MEKANVQKSNIKTAMILLAISTSITSTTWGANNNLPVPAQGRAPQPRITFESLPPSRRAYVRELELFGQRSGLEQRIVQELIPEIELISDWQPALSNLAVEVHLLEVSQGGTLNPAKREIRTRQILMEYAFKGLGELAKMVNAQKEKRIKPKVVMSEEIADSALIYRLVNEHLLQAIKAESQWNDAKRLGLARIFQVIAEVATEFPYYSVGQVSKEMRRRVGMSEEARNACKE